MTTFGETTEGANISWWSANNYRGGLYVAPNTGTLAKFSAFAYEDRSGAVYVKGVLIDAADNMIVENGITAPALAPTGSLTWFDLIFATPPNVIAGHSYYLALIIDSGSSNFGIAYDAGQCYYSTGLYANPADWTVVNSGAAEGLSIYATYQSVVGEIVLVNGTDRSAEIDFQSFNLNRAKTSQVDTFSFRVSRQAGDWKPEILDVVTIYEGADIIFGGQIIDISSKIEGNSLEILEVYCKDFAFEMDRKMVVDSFENMTVDAIISSIVSDFITGFTITNVNAPVEIGFIAFNYEYPSKCLQQLAELINYDWYVDENKDIHFFSKNSSVAPFALTDDNGKYYFNSLNIKKSVTGLRNTIVVRGGTFQGDLTTENQKADGGQTTFTWAYQYSNVAVTVGGVSKTIGIDNITDPTTVDCLYNFAEKAIKFRADNLPAANSVVALSGNPHIPVIIKLEDRASVAEFGTFEYKIIDKSINTKQGARDRAKAEILSYAAELEEGSFQTKEPGLKVGQKINVSSVIRGIDEDFYINKISTKLINGMEMMHTVSLVTTKTMGMVDFLQRLLMQKDKEIIINDDEVVDLINPYSEDITITENFVSAINANLYPETVTATESFTAQALDYAVAFGLGSFAPNGTKRAFILDGSRLA